MVFCKLAVLQLDLLALVLPVNKEVIILDTVAASESLYASSCADVALLHSELDAHFYKINAACLTILF